MGLLTFNHTVYHFVMAECPTCSGFDERIHLSAHEYRYFALQLIEFVAKGTFLMIAASTPLEEIAEGHWHGDVESHNFLCSTCNRPFQLSADTYHGNAGWYPGPEPPESSADKLLQ